MHPGVALILRAGQDLHHLWLLNACRDEEEAALFVSDLPHNQLLKGDDCGALVLQGEEGWVKEGRDGRRQRGKRMEKKKDDSGRVKEEKGEEGRQMLRIGRGWERREEGWGEVRGGEEEEMDNYRGREGGRKGKERQKVQKRQTCRMKGGQLGKKKDYRKSEQLVIKREKEKRKKIRFWLSST